MAITVKICGITTPEAAHETAALDCTYAGFIFFPTSPRNVTLETASTLSTMLPRTTHSVAVTVDADDMQIDAIMRIMQPNALQLHGAEPPKRLAELRAKYPATRLIKALKIHSSDDVAKASLFTEVTDMLLFDAKPPKHGLPGGNGLSFDWALLAGRMFEKPWFLSGGLSAHNIAHALHASGAVMVDVSSSVERAPGVKDIKLMREFVSAVRASESTKQ